MNMPKRCEAGLMPPTDAKPPTVMSRWSPMTGRPSPSGARLVVDQRADGAALDGGGEVLLVDVEDLVHPLHEHHGAAGG